MRILPSGLAAAPARRSGRGWGPLPPASGRMEGASRRRVNCSGGESGVLLFLQRLEVDLVAFEEIGDGAFDQGAVEPLDEEFRRDEVLAAKVFSGFAVGFEPRLQVAEGADLHPVAAAVGKEDDEVADVVVGIVLAGVEVVELAPQFESGGCRNRSVALERVTFPESSAG